MREDLGVYPEQPMAWYALFFAYLFGLITHAYPLQGLFCLFILYSISLSRKKSFYILTILCFIIGFFYGEIPQPNTQATPAWFEENKEEEFYAKVENVRSLTDRRWRVILSDISLASDTSSPLEGKMSLYFYCDTLEDFAPPLAGMHIQFKGKVKSVKYSSNPGIIDGEQYWYDKNIFYTGYLNPERASFSYSGKAHTLAKIRMDLIQSYIQICKDENNKVSQGHAFLIGILFGEKFYFDTKVTNLFTKASLVHTLALSGMHLAFVGFCAFVLLKIITYLKPRLFLRIPHTIAIGIFSVPFACIYLWLGNYAISLIRAVLMLICMWIFVARYRNLSLLDALCLVTFLILLFSPRAWADISFQLSVLAVLSIALSAPLFTALKNFMANRRENFYFPWYIKLGLAILALAWTSFVIQIFLFPIQGYTFGTFSPYFYLNIIWIPLVELLILPLAFLGFFTMSIPPISEIFIGMASFITSNFINFLSYFDEVFTLRMWQVYRFDLWQGIGFYTFILACLCYKNFRKRSYLLFSLACICLFTQPLYARYDTYLAKNEERMTITALSVGQGQSILLEWAGKRAIIDAGGVFGDRFDTGRDIIAKVLTYQNFPNLHYAIISHFDLDHVKGYFHIAQHFNIDAFIYPEYDKGKSLKTALLHTIREEKIPEMLLKTGDIIMLEPDIYWLEVLFPPAKGNFSSNNASLVLRLVHRGKGIALFCGDIENSGIRRLLALNQELSADLLVLPHHGSKHSYYEEFYEKVNPTKVISSSGLNNRYNYPASIIVEYFADKGIQVQDTGKENALSYTYKR